MENLELSYEQLLEYRNYLYALQWYRLYGNQYGDKDYIDMYEEKQKEKELVKCIKKCGKN